MSPGESTIRIFFYTHARHSNKGLTFILFFNVSWLQCMHWKENSNTSKKIITETFQHRMYCFYVLSVRLLEIELKKFVCLSIWFFIFNFSIKKNGNESW